MDFESASIRFLLADFVIFFVKVVAAFLHLLIEHITEPTASLIINIFHANFGSLIRRQAEKLVKIPRRRLRPFLAQQEQDFR